MRLLFEEIDLCVIFDDNIMCTNKKYELAFWDCKKQNLIALSIVEVKYIATRLCCVQIL